MRVRTIITIAVLCIYLAGFNFYLYELTRIAYPTPTLIYNYLTLGMLLFAFLDIKAGLFPGLHEQFNSICFLSLIVNYTFIILTHHELIKQPKYMFYTFNGMELVVTIALLVNLKKYGFL